MLINISGEVAQEIILINSTLSFYFIFHIGKGYRIQNRLKILVKLFNHKLP